MKRILWTLIREIMFFVMTAFIIMLVISVCFLLYHFLPWSVIAIIFILVFIGIWIADDNDKKCPPDYPI